jgi:hypothetical protein
MKRYLLFRGLTYTPDGGWYDMASAHDTLADAENALVCPTHPGQARFVADWAHIVDIEQGCIVSVLAVGDWLRRKEQ